MALGTTLPFWPALLFTYIEPISLLLGCHAATTTPSTFVSQHLPSSIPSSPPTITPSAHILSNTIGNIFVLLAGLAIVCTLITREARVTKWYLGMVAAADLGHIYASYHVMGGDAFWNFGQYTDVMWGNIGFSAFLHVNRVATLLGVFGRVGGRR